MGVLKILGIVAAAFAVPAIFGSKPGEASPPPDDDPKLDPTKLAGWDFVEAGPADGPLVVLLAEGDAGKAIAAVQDLGAHLVVPLARHLGPDGAVYVDPSAGESPKALLETAVALSGFVAAGVQRWPGKTRIVLAGLGRRAGSLAALVGLSGPLAIRASCRLNSGISDPLEPSTLPKRTVMKRGAPGSSSPSRSSDWQ
jgi:hypothetical protein